MLEQEIGTNNIVSEIEDHLRKIKDMKDMKKTLA